MKDIVFLTGVSGAGKSTAISFLEDIGFYCIDNLPAELVPTFIGLIEKSDSFSRIAIVTDIRSKADFDDFGKVIEKMKYSNENVKVIYLDVKNHIALKRYKLTRRKHPYADMFSGSIEDALNYEKDVLSPLRLRSDYVIDTTDFSSNQLKERLTQILIGDDKAMMNINVMSFGFKHGIPTDADFVLDVRCLPNPYWVEALRSKTGLDEEVRDYVFSFNESNELLDKLIKFLDFLNPLYIKEGKSQLVIAIGCTGGNHRSVAIAEALAKHFSRHWDNISVNHRDIERR